MGTRIRLHSIMHGVLRTAAASAALVAVLGVAVAPAADEPMAVVKSLVNRALEVLRDKREPLRVRQDKLREIINGNFDFTAMSRSALGYHWREISDAQRKDFTQTFTSFIQDSYLSKIQDYAGQQVEFARTMQPDRGYAMVATNVMEPGKQPIPVNYALEERNGRWLIYDVTVDNISIIANYRNQFSRVINRDGFAKLVADLKSKQQQLAAGLGTPHPHN